MIDPGPVCRLLPARKLRAARTSSLAAAVIDRHIQRHARFVRRILFQLVHALPEARGPTQCGLPESEYGYCDLRTESYRIRYSPSRRMIPFTSSRGRFQFSVEKA